MGGRGAFIKEKGIIKFRYEVVGFIDGVKILEPRNKSEEHSLPERANTPCTSYVSYKRDGTFNHFITLIKIECQYMQLIMESINTSYHFMFTITKMVIDYMKLNILIQEMNYMKNIKNYLKE